MFNLILVPLDGSAYAEAALAVAERIPSRRLRLLNVQSDLDDLRAVYGAEWDYQTYLEVVAAPLRRAGREVETVVVFGDPARQIVDVAANADLVVMGSHGRGAVGRFLLGSVAAWVARHAPAPTIIVPAGEVATAPLARVVVPLDGSALAETALPAAIALAEVLGLPLHLVRVVPFDAVRASAEAAIAAARAYVKSRAAIVRQANSYLAEQVEKLRHRKLAATSELRAGDAAGELLAAFRPGDVVVLATHDRGGMQRWFLGSVADKLLQHATIPAMVVPASARNPRRKQPDASAAMRPRTARSAALQASAP